MIAAPWLDLCLIGVLLVAAVSVLAAPDDFQAAVMFIVFGLLMALGWTRLGAPDVALAEAAIGAGLTGVLVLKAIASEARAERQASASRRAGRARLHRLLAAALGLPLVTAIGSALLAERVGGTASLGRAAASQLARSGASNPVTAVLLNFRGYDTLLEIAVLFAAVAATWAIASRGPRSSLAVPSTDSDPILLALVRLLVPFCVVMAAYLLWAGAAAPGGAFQAAAVLSAAGILLVVSGMVDESRVDHRVVHGAVAAGPLLFLGVAVAMSASGRAFLEYPTGAAGPLILVIETALTLSIGATLLSLFIGGDRGRRSARD
jgi:multisubunit Na+/H+ antiporter MnhB subunit